MGIQLKVHLHAEVAFFADSPLAGHGATIRLDSGEPCLLSCAQSWVRVKKSRFGLLGPVLYNEKNAAVTAKALGLLFPHSLLPPGFRDPILCAFANAILHCSTCAEVRMTLNEAISRADAKIVSDYAAFMTTTTTKLDWFYDVNVLPHPKEVIVAAIEREIVREPHEVRVEWLRTGTAFLWNFLEGIGADPLPSTGLDLEQLPRGVTPTDFREALKRIYANPNLKRNEERAKRFSAIAEREDHQIKERITAAVRMRNGRLAGGQLKHGESR